MNESNRCRACQVPIAPTEQFCTNCQPSHDADQVDDADQQVDAAYASPTSEQEVPPTFGIGSMMLVVTLVAIVLGLFMIEPLSGIAVAVLATPALVRTALRIQKGKRQGETFSIPQKGVAFLASLGIMTATVASVGIAFYATCWGGFYAGMFGGSIAGQSGYDPLGTGLIVGCIAGGIAALICGFFAIRWWWPIRLK